MLFKKDNVALFKKGDTVIFNKLKLKKRFKKYCKGLPMHFNTKIYTIYDTDFNLDGNQIFILSNNKDYIFYRHPEFLLKVK